MVSATSVNSVTELVKDAVKSVVGSGSEAEASLIPFHDHASKQTSHSLTAICELTDTKRCSEIGGIKRIGRIRLIEPMQRMKLILIEIL